MAHLPSQRRFISAALAASLVALLSAAAASTAASTGPVSADLKPPIVELLSRGTTAKAFDAEAAGIELEADHKIDVAMARVTFPTGSSSGWHYHPGPTVVTVTKGRMTFISDHCVRHRLKPGDTFVENGGPRDVGRLNNKTGPQGEVTVTFFAPPGGDPLTIPAPPPACASNS
jgi:quercetin dioxygenase-like cupin family protein